MVDQSGVVGYIAEEESAGLCVVLADNVCTDDWCSVNSQLKLPRCLLFIY